MITFAAAVVQPAAADAAGDAKVRHGRRHALRDGADRPRVGVERLGVRKVVGVGGAVSSAAGAALDERQVRHLGHGSGGVQARVGARRSSRMRQDAATRWSRKARMADVETARDGDVLTITLNRPDVLNALTSAVHAALAAASKSAFSGRAGGRADGSGPQLRRPGPDRVQRVDRRHHRAPPSTYHPNILAIRELEKPIAAINGPAAGAGLSFALACDLRIAADSASFIPAFVGIGLIPDSGGTFFATRLLEYARAFEWLTSNRELTARGARLGARVGGRGGRPTRQAAGGGRAAVRGGSHKGHRDDEAAARSGRGGRARGTARLGGADAGRRDADGGLPRGR